MKIGTIGHWKFLEKKRERPCEEPIEYFEAKEVVIAKEANEGEDDSGYEISLSEDGMVVCQ